MKKSAAVTFGVLMTTLILASCGQDRRCVDENGVVVADEKCREDDKKRSRTGFVGGHRWYYGGSGRSVGSRATGGSFTVARGGFGRLAGFHGSGGS